jgi:polysaccharide biosynthesis/export protein
VSSLSTLVNAVFAAGGPSTTGSMRAIQLKRGAQVVTEFDLYDLLLRGDKSKDAALLPGDVIYFPPRGRWPPSRAT